MSKLLVHRAALTNIVRRIALAAGEMALDHQEGFLPDHAGYKADGSPVTTADRNVERFILDELYKALPDVPIIGEELVAEGAAPALSDANEYVWFVDAIDGTREFIAGGDEYTVNIALVKCGVPVVGVVYAPAKGELYAGYTEEDGSARAIRWHEESDRDKDISVRPVPRVGMTVMMSKSRTIDSRMEEYLSQFKVEKLVKRASSLKLCAIAAGKADLYPRFGPTCVWDIAAGHAILEAAGGQIATSTGGRLQYNMLDPKFFNPDFVASGGDISETP